MSVKKTGVTFLGLSVVAILSFFPNNIDGLTKWLFVHLSYYFMLGIFLFLTYQIYKYTKIQIWNDARKKKNMGIAAILALLFSIIIFKTHPTGMKINGDESSLLQVSKSMTYNKTAYWVTSGKQYFENFQPTNTILPVRPSMFPFLISLVNTVKGYGIDSALWVNFIGLFSLFLLIFNLGLMHSGLTLAVALGLGLASLPILGIHATSAGFDMFAVSAFAFAVWAYFKPRQYDDLFLAAIMFLAHIRYESLLLSSLLFFFRYSKQKQIFEKKVIYHGLLFSLSVIPHFWQRALTKGRYQVKANETWFSLDNFINHLPSFFENFTNFTGTLPFNSVLILSTVISIVLIISRSNLRSKALKFLPIGIIVLCHCLLMMAHNSGSWTHPATGRYFILEHVACVFLLGFVAIECLKTKPQLKYTLGFFLISFLIYFPKGIEHRFMDSLLIYRETQKIEQFFASKPKNILILHRTPTLISAFGFGTVSHTYAKQNWQQIWKERERALYEELYAVERIDYGKESRYKDKAGFHPVKKYQYSATRYLLISKFSPELANTSNLSIPPKVSNR